VLFCPVQRKEHGPFRPIARVFFTFDQSIILQDIPENTQKIIAALQQFTLHCKILLDKSGKFRLNHGENRNLACDHT
jgi:hypothetical protein